MDCVFCNVFCVRRIMNKINIVCVGKIKEKFYTDAISEYVKRMSRFAKINIVELSEKENIEKESESIIKALKGYKIVLAIEGEKTDSITLAKKIKVQLDKGNELTFVIGSSCGLDAKVKNQADYLLSFSDMTFPHQLMRVILCEQLYRAFMINAGSEYHK